MNSDELNKKNIELERENEFLRTQHGELKAMAEKSGSEKAVIQSKFFLLEEEHRKLQNEMSRLKVIKNGKNKS